MFMVIRGEQQQHQQPLSIICAAAGSGVLPSADDRTNKERQPLVPLLSISLPRQ